MMPQDNSAAARRIGEVIEASTTEFIAQSYALHDPPAFGQLVRTSDGQREILGVTAITRTGSLDPGRRPIARGQDEEAEEDIYLHNPELPQLLRTEFTTTIVGFRGDNGIWQQHLPPRPARIHGFVYTCSLAEVSGFTEQLDFLQILAHSSVQIPADELIAACIREAARGHHNARGFLIRAGKQLAIVHAGDPNRLGALLRRIRK